MQKVNKICGRRAKNPADKKHQLKYGITELSVKGNVISG